MHRRSLIIATCLAFATAPSPLVAALSPGSAGAARGQTGVRSVAGDTIRIVVYNIHHGEGMDTVVDLDRIAALIAAYNPHLVALQEVDRGTQRTGVVDQAAALGRLIGLTPVFGEFMPYQGGQYGMAVLSGLPIVESTNHRLPDGDEPRSALAVRVRLPTGGDLIFTGIHFYRTEEERLAQATTLLRALDSDTIPVVLAGDFNSTPGSPVMMALAERFAIIDKGADHLTFSSFEPVREIDFVLIRPASRFEVIEHHPLNEPVASDHRPLVATIVVKH